MEVLKLVTEFYTLSVQSSNPQKSWKRFQNRLCDKADTYCDYSSSIIGILSLCDLNSGKLVHIEESQLKWEAKQPVFFETNVYNFALEFHQIKGKPMILHPNKDVADLFSYFPSSNGGILTGSINFLNEPGKFSLNVAYDTANQRNRIDNFTFDVVSPKLDTKDDYKSIIETINKEYNELVYKYLSLTFQQFGKKGKSSNDLIWLAIFQEIIGGYLQACNYIINKPHFKPKKEIYYQKPDRIKRWTPKMEEKYYEKVSIHKNDTENIYFRNELVDTTVDTKENRFVKFTIQQLDKKLSTVLNKLKKEYTDSLSDEYLHKLISYDSELEKLKKNRLFRTIGQFEGFRQESVVLQKRTGYAQIYRYWLLLQSGLSLFNGTTNIGVKQIWELYELWCFLKMKEIIGSLDYIKIEEENKESMLKPFSESKVEHCITFINTINEDKIKLCYQHTYNRNTKETLTTTTEQRPDIVLNIIKKDTGFTLTYLYDAKYRVEDDDKDSENINVADKPVPDAINQMHRYRDAIYYGQNKTVSAKEIIGGYVLFPGRGDDNTIRNTYYQKSIDSINIGAFPLLPCSDKQNEGSLLKEHLKAIILDQSKTEQIEKAIPQKGLTYQETNEMNVFVGVVNKGNKLYKSFVTQKGVLYYSGRSFPSTCNILSFKFFAPYYNGGVREYYEICGIRSAKKNEIKEFEDNIDDGIRFFFELKNCTQLSDNPIKCPLIKDTYQVTSLADLK